MNIIQVEQRTDEWHEWRNEGVSASDSPVILGLSPYKTTWLLWAQKKGLIEPDDLSRNPHVRRGLEYEDDLRKTVEQEIGDILLPICAEYLQNPIFRASLDGLDRDAIPHELKCPCEKQWVEVNLLGTESEAYKLYYPQVQHQLLVTDAEFGYLHFGFMDSNETFQKRTFKIFRDDAMIKEIIHHGTEFWSSIVNNIPPKKDKERDFYEPEGEDAVTWKELSDKARSVQAEIVKLQSKLDELKSQRNDIQQQAADIMGDFKSGLYSGLQVTRVDRLGALDLNKALRTLLPKETHDKLDQWLEQFRKKGSQYHVWSVNDDNEKTPVYVSPDNSKTHSNDWF